MSAPLKIVELKISFEKTFCASICVFYFREKKRIYRSRFRFHLVVSLFLYFLVCKSDFRIDKTECENVIIIKGILRTLKSILNTRKKFSERSTKVHFPTLWEIMTDGPTERQTRGVIGKYIHFIKASPQDLFSFRCDGRTYRRSEGRL